MKSILCLLLLSCTSYAASPLDKAKAVVIVEMEMLALNKIKSDVPAPGCICKDCKCENKTICPTLCPPGPECTCSECKCFEKWKCSAIKCPKPPALKEPTLTKSSPFVGYEYKWNGKDWILQSTCTSCSSCTNGTCVQK